MQLGAGTHLGPYVLERRLGVGAFGVVWLAHRTDSAGDVAIKILHPSAAESPETVERFRREAYALAQLRSAHIARMFEFTNFPPYGMALIMEYVPGDMLSEALEKMRLSVEQSIYLGLHLLSGIQEMHANGIIHRDIKPENVILRPAQPSGWTAVIFDFNLSRLKGSKGLGGKPPSSLTAMGSAIGTVPYMAPEQLLDARRVTEAADVYSVGAILFHAVAGYPPFDTKTGFRDKLTLDAPLVPTGRNDGLAAQFVTVVAKALARKPADRYPDAPAMRAALSLLLRASRP